MATTAELVRRLKKAGFRLSTHGGRHDIYVNASGVRVTVPRYAKEMPNGTYRAILKDAGLS